MSEATWDAVVVGAGPSGCATATALARAGRKTLLLDRDEKPRFKIGESLLPFNIPIFEKLGFLPKLKAAAFQEKYGAFFWNERTGGTRSVVFRTALESPYPMAYQVQRQRFDGLLAEHAAESGATVRRGVAASELVFESGRAVGVKVKSPAGEELIRSRIVVDATGQAALVASRMKMRKGDPNLRRAAVYAHYKGVWRPEGEHGGDILLPFLPDVWYWAIPFSDGTTSVGAVFDPRLAAGRADDREGLLGDLLSRSAKMRELLANAERISPVYATSDYSITADRFSGDGWVLVGDAATFLDPVFSTGVLLGMSAGVRAAAVVDRSLTSKGRVDGADFREYERVTRNMVARFRPFVYGYYDTSFTRQFCEKGPDLLERAVTAILAGNTERPSLRVRFLTRLVLLAFAWGKLLDRDARNGTVPAGAPQPPDAGVGSEREQRSHAAP